ncbi:MAG: serine/threonine protein kinase [Pirellulales bacterium]|nr:serine/threonine protein kinase [Pirellulales bacterium]
MSADNESSTFERCAIASGLLTKEQIEAARDNVRWSSEDEPDPSGPPSDRMLADRLIEMKLLNPWQAVQLLEGRTKFNLGPYQIIDSIGQGGAGQVFKARHAKIGRVVAIKVLPREKSTPEAIANFTREIRSLAALDHPKLVAALDAGEDGNVLYLVTEFVPGQDLRKLVRDRGPLEMPAAASIISQVAEGLKYAHQQGIVHRDVKPGNVLVAPDGSAKLSDLGFASPLNDSAADDPRRGKIVGTADYLSPDQVRDPWNPTPGWDIYSLGCTLYYAVTGKVPFPGGTTADKARAHCELRPLDPRRLNPRLSAEFVDVMADMMAKEPSQRIAAADEVVARLASYLNPISESLSRRPPPPPIVAQRLEEEQSSSREMQIPTGFDPMKILWPLTVFVLAPAALIGTTVLLWWLVRNALR